MRRFFASVALLVALFTPGVPQGTAEDNACYAADGPSPAIPPPAFLLRMVSAEPDAPKLVRPAGLAKGKKWVPVYHLEGTIDDDSVNPLIAWLRAAEKVGADGVLVHIDTMGGDVQEGMRLIREFENSNLRVSCVVDSNAISMGMAILQACDERSMTPRSRLMAHEAYFLPRTTSVILTAIEKFNMAARMAAVNYAMAYQYGHRMHGGAAEVRLRLAGGHEWWMAAEEATKAGAVDCVVPSTYQALQALEDGRSCRDAGKYAPRKKG